MTTRPDFAHMTVEQFAQWYEREYERIRQAVAGKTPLTPEQFAAKMLARHSL